MIIFCIAAKYKRDERSFDLGFASPFSQQYKSRFQSLDEVRWPFVPQGITDNWCDATKKP